MKLLISSLFILSCGGCCRSVPVDRDSAAPENFIQLGQTFADAISIAKSCGYKLKDASALSTDPELHGFYLDLPGDQGLLICHSASLNVVNSIELIDGWNGPKAFRKFHDIASYNLKRRI